MVRLARINDRLLLRGDRRPQGPLSASQAAAYYRPMTIVHYDYKPKRQRKPVVEFPCGRIVAARKPKPRHYGEIRYGVPDEAQRTALIAEFIERTLKPQG